MYISKYIRTDYKDVCLDILSDIDSIINTCDAKSVIIGGDFNCNLDILNWSSKIIREFMIDNDLVLCHETNDESELDYTYCHESLQHFSYVDYFSCLLPSLLTT